MPVRIQWLGQAGYALFAPSGDVCLIDAYLSDYCNDELNLPRIAPVVFDVKSVSVLVSVSTHWHPDHLDPVTSRMLAANLETIFVGPPANMGRLDGWGVAAGRLRALQRDETIQVGPFNITGCFARHDVPGWICEDALTYVIEVDGVRVFHTGDTEYDARIRAARRYGPIDVGLFASNGTGGNMNSLEAALLAVQLAPRTAIPMHYAMWGPEGYGGSRETDVFRSTLDPNAFVIAYKALGGGDARILEVGDTIEVGKSS